MRTLLLAAALLLSSASAFAAEPWTEADLVQPEALAARLTQARAAKPTILYIGPAVLYRSKHIPGAALAGPAATPEGLALLRRALERIPRTAEVVLYCGCCPWQHCPNLIPAFQLLREMSFRKGRILWLPTSFYTDWISKGYPIER